MDLIKTISDLRREKEKMEWLIASLEALHATARIQDLRRGKKKLEQVITSLEELHAAGSIPPKGWRSRRPMSIEERREVSDRMKRYWEDRRNQRRPWS